MRIVKRVLPFLVLLGAVSAAVLHYHSRRGPDAAQAGSIPALLSLAPADSRYLMYADLATLRSSPFLAQLVALAPSPAMDRDYAEFVRATGFDYSRDLDHVLLAVRPGSPTTSSVALAEGRFDHERISGYAQRSGRVEHQNGVEVYVFPANTPAKAVAFAFLDTNRVALADGPSLAAVLAPRTGSTLDPAMRERISRVSGAAFFAVGQIGPLPENFSPGGVRSDQLANLVRSLRWFSLAGRPEGDRLKVAVEAECDTPDNARQLVGTLDGLRLFGQAALADPRMRQRLPHETLALLQSLLPAVEISRDDQLVRLIVQLTPEILRDFPRATAPNYHPHQPRP